MFLLDFCFLYLVLPGLRGLLFVHEGKPWTAHTNTNILQALHRSRLRLFFIYFLWRLCCCFMTAFLGTSRITCISGEVWVVRASCRPVVSRRFFLVGYFSWFSLPFSIGSGGCFWAGRSIILKKKKKPNDRQKRITSSHLHLPSISKSKVGRVSARGGCAI